MADVVVIGAGAAGLAASRRLAEHGVKVTLLEARSRAGGRMHSQVIPGLPVAVELGAEFIHGTPRDTWDLIREARLDTREMKGSHWCADNAPPAPCGETAEAETVMDRMQRYRGPDLSFSLYLAKQVADLPSAEKDWASEYVQGFNAADPEKVSVHWLNQSAEAEEQDHGDRIFCLNQGYSALASYMLRSLPREKVEVHFSTPVRNIFWKRGYVRVESEHGSFEADRAIITLPIGVLRAGSVWFHPACASLQAIQSIESGGVVRVTFVFRECFWIRRNAEFSDMCMLHTKDPDFPTWWSVLPVVAPVLTGWAAGPRAQRLSTYSTEEIITRAVRALSRALGCDAEEVDEQVVSAHTHNWQIDEYSCGAYSYAGAGTASAAGELAAPAEDTLFFAGEATERTGRSGLVHGAISTGNRAAQRILALR